MEFPRLVYRSASEHVLAEDQEQFDALCKDGWFATVPEAMAGKSNEPIKHDDPPTREELEAKAGELQIKFDGRTSDDKLGKLIAEKLAA